MKGLVKNWQIPSVETSIAMAVIMSAVIIVTDLFLYKGRFDLLLNKFKTPYRWAVYTVLLFFIMALSGTQKFTFIYFQF